jgi:hypothetical protein
VGDNLYRRATSSGVLLKCVSSEKDKEILDEIHSGCCENHTASRTLVRKKYFGGNGVLNFVGKKHFAPDSAGQLL